jgi:hypothetical protein
VLILVQIGTENEAKSDGITGPEAEGLLKSTETPIFGATLTIRPCICRLQSL